MKKFLGFSIALIVMMSCIFCLAACDLGSGGDDYVPGNSFEGKTFVYKETKPAFSDTYDNMTQSEFLTAHFADIKANYSLDSADITALKADLIAYVANNAAWKSTGATFVFEPDTGGARYLSVEVTFGSSKSTYYYSTESPTDFAVMLYPDTNLEGQGVIVMLDRDNGNQLFLAATEDNNPVSLKTGGEMNREFAVVNMYFEVQA